MKLVGEYLKQSRIKKKLNLKKISAHLNISENIIKNIEDDNFPNYIDTVYMIGHLRSYAKFLNLDQSQIVENFKVQISFYDNNLVKEIQKPIRFKGLSFLPKTLSIFSILIISSSFYFLFIKDNKFESNFAMTPNIPEIFEPILEKAEIDIAMSNYELIDNEEKIISENENIIKDQSTDLTSQTSVIASLPSKFEENQLKEIITLKFLNSTWIQLRDIDDKIIFSKLMNENDEYSYSISQNLNLTAGNAGNIIVLIDGMTKGKAGKAGEVIESLIIDKQYNN